ncbi:hypothetical protein HDU67_002086 [Dinochytrium kinnereticum]|nr:hypothetical protein HDU67_002086 [Dinochytrium kinnereticum]
MLDRLVPYGWFALKTAQNKYVRKTVSNESTREKVREALSQGLPFCEVEQMIVVRANPKIEKSYRYLLAYCFGHPSYPKQAMIDISGYSALASLLEGTLGKMSSEIITQTVGTYMAKVSDIIFQYQGDIVKFLGDAVLVTFSAVDKNEDQDSIRRRAAICCLEILVKCPTQQIDLESWSQMLKATQPGLSGTAREYDSGLIAKDESVLQKTYQLSLHIALAEGLGSRVIIGILSERLDYLIYSDSLQHLGDLLDGTKSGEIGLPMSLAFDLGIEFQPEQASRGFIVLMGKALQNTLDVLYLHNPAHIQPSLKKSFTKSDIDINGCIYLSDEVRSMLRLFVNKSILWRLNDPILSIKQTDAGDLTEREKPAISSMGNFIFFSHVTLGRDSSMGAEKAPFEIKDVRQILMDCHENPAYAGAIFSIITGETSAGTDSFPKGMDAEGRKTILKSIIVHVLAFLSSRQKAALLLDDAQWIDTTSLEIFYSLADEHPTTFMGVFSRLIKPLDASHVLHKLAASPVIEHLPLSGLGREDLGKMLVESLGAVSVHEPLLNDIHQQTRGNLLQTDALIRFLMDHSSEYIIITAAGEVQSRQPKELANFLSKSVETVIIAQFDRLHPDFQHILRLASVLGQYFSISELNLLLSGENLSADDIWAIITKNDQFEFLKVFKDLSGSEEAASFSGEIFFRHISIMNAIYASIAFSEREALHLKMATHYEGIIASIPGRKTQLLPVVCYHYARTGKASKMLERNSELGFELATSCLFPEALKALVSVNEYLANNREDLQQTLETEARYLLEPWFQSKLYAFLSMSYAMSRRFADGRDMAINCLKIAGFTWPIEPKAIKKETMRAVGTFIRYWFKSKRGRKDIPVTKKSPKAIQGSWFLLVKVSLKSLLQGLLYGAVEKHYWFNIMVWSAYTIAQSGEPIPLLLSKWAIQESSHIKSRGDGSCRAALHLYGGLVKLYYLNINEAIEDVKNFEEYWQERRVKVEYVKIFTAAGPYSFYTGSLKRNTLRLTDDWIAEMRKVDGMMLAGAVGPVQAECFWNGNVTAFEKYHKIELEYAEKVPESVLLRIGNLRKGNVLIRKMLYDEPAGSIFSAAKDVIDSLLTLSITIHHHATFMYCFLASIAFTAVDYTSPTISKEALKLASTSLETIRKRLSRIRKYSCNAMLSEAICIVIHCHILGVKHKSVLPIRRLLKSKVIKGRIQMGDQLCMIGAMGCALIGLSSSDATESRLNITRAQTMFHEMEAPTLERWVAGQLRFR